MTAGLSNKLPFGNYPRLLHQAVRTQSRELVLGKSLAEFMRELGIHNSGGREGTKVLKKIKLAWPELNSTAKGVILSLSHPRPAHSVSWSSPRIAQERPNASRVLPMRRSRQSLPHPKGRPKPGKFRRGPPADAVRALRPARATGQRQSVVPEMPPVPQEGPLTRSRSDERGHLLSYQPPQSGLERF